MNEADILFTLFLPILENFFYILENENIAIWLVLLVLLFALSSSLPIFSDLDFFDFASPIINIIIIIATLYFFGATPFILFLVIALFVVASIMYLVKNTKKRREHYKHLDFEKVALKILLFILIFFISFNYLKGDHTPVQRVSPKFDDTKEFTPLMLEPIPEEKLEPLPPEESAEQKCLKDPVCVQNIIQKQNIQQNNQPKNITPTPSIPQDPRMVPQPLPNTQEKREVTPKNYPSQPKQPETIQKSVPNQGQPPQQQKSYSVPTLLR